jgi:hypothetical protein
MAKQTLERGMDVRRVPESRPLGALAESEARNQRGKSGSEFRAEFDKADEVVSAGRAGMQEQTGEKRGGLAVHASFYPEGGELVAGLPSRVYFHCRDAIGKPVDVVGRLVDQDGDVVAEARTAQAGRGFFELTPTGGQSYSLRIGEPQGASDPPERLAVSDGRTIVLHVEKTCLAADDPLSLRICSIRGDAQLVVAVYCRGVIVGQQLADRSQFVRGTSNWECQFAVPLTSEADGLLRVTALDVDRSPPETVAERLVYRRPRKKLDVHIENLDEVASADGKVQLRVMTTDETSAPVPAVLSVGVVDNTVSQLDPASQTQLPAFAYLANEIRDAEELENANFFLSEEARAELALDLLLGTQDWRRFMDTTLQALAQSANPSRHGQRTLALGEALDVIVRKEGRESQESPSRRAGLPTEIAPIDVVPVVYDNTAQVERSVAEAELAEQAAHAAARRRLGQVLCLGGSALAIAVMLLLVARVSLAARAWAPALTAAGVSLFVGVYWWEGGFHVGSQVALRPKTEAARATPSEPVRKLEEAERLADRASYGAPAPLAPEAATSVPPPAAAAVPSAAVDDASPGNRDSLDYRSYGAGSLAARSDPQQPAVEQFGAAMERGVQPAPGLQRRATAEGQTAGVGVRPAASPPAPVAANERSQERMGREGKAMLDLRPQDPAAMEAAKPFSVGAGAGGFSGGGAYVPFPQKGVAPSAGATLSVGKHPVATGFPIRQFAFQRDRKDEPANQVSGTLYWSPIVNTGKDGRATIEFDLSEAPPGIRLLIDGHAPGRLGSMDQVVVPRPAAAARQQ